MGGKVSFSFYNNVSSSECEEFDWGWIVLPDVTVPAILTAVVSAATGKGVAGSGLGGVVIMSLRLLRFRGPAEGVSASGVPMSEALANASPMMCVDVPGVIGLRRGNVWLWVTLAGERIACLGDIWLEVMYMGDGWLGVSCTEVVRVLYSWVAGDRVV